MTRWCTLNIIKMYSKHMFHITDTIKIQLSINFIKKNVWSRLCLFHIERQKTKGGKHRNWMYLYNLSAKVLRFDSSMYVTLKDLDNYYLTFDTSRTNSVRRVFNKLFVYGNTPLSTTTCYISEFYTLDMAETRYIFWYCDNFE